MEYINVKRLHEDAILPRKAHTTDACFDLFAVGLEYEELNENWIFYTEIAIEIPKGYYGQILTRSGMARDGIVVIGGVIDSGYRGEIKVIVHVLNSSYDFEETGTLFQKFIDESQAVAQLAILPVPPFDMVEVNELSPSERGENGFGSTDQKI